MKKLLTTLTFILFFVVSAFSQIYQPTQVTQFGMHVNRIKGDSVMGIPRIYDTLFTRNPADTFPSLYMWDDTLWSYTHGYYHKVGAQSILFSSTAGKYVTGYGTIGILRTDSVSEVLNRYFWNQFYAGNGDGTIIQYDVSDHKSFYVNLDYSVVASKSYVTAAGYLVVSDTTAMKAITVSAPAIIITDSLTGGILDHYSSGAGLTVDNFTVYAASDGGTWRRRIVGGVVYPEWIGISNTATSTNNRKNLQKIANVTKRGWTIHFKDNSRYQIDSTVTFTGIKNLHIKNNNVRFDSTKTHYTMFIFEKCDSLKINDWVIDGASATNPDLTRRSAIVVDSSNDVIIENVTGRNIKKNLFEFEFCSRATVRDCHGDSIGRDFCSWSPCYGCVLENSHVRNGLQGGLVEFSDSTSNSIVRNCSAVKCFYMMDVDYHGDVLCPSCQVNNNNAIIDSWSDSCGTFWTHGIGPENGTYLNHNFSIIRCKVMHGTGNIHSNGDIDISSNFDGLIIEDFQVIKPLYTGTVIKIQKTDNLKIIRPKFSKGLTNHLISVIGGTLANTYGNGLEISGMIADSLPSTDAGQWAVNIAQQKNIEFHHNKINGSGAYAADMIQIVDVSWGQFHHNLLDSTTADIFDISNTTAQSFVSITDNLASSGIGKMVHDNTGNTTGLDVRNNQPTANGKYGLGASLSNNIFGNKFVFDNTNGRLEIGDLTPPTSPLTILSTTTPQVTEGQTASKTVTRSYDASGNMIVSNNAGSTSQTYSASQFIVLANMYVGNATHINAPFAATDGSELITNSSFKYSGSTQSTYWNSWFRPGTGITATAGTSGGGIMLGGGSWTSASSGNTEYLFGALVKGKSATLAGSGTLGVHGTLAVDSALAIGTDTMAFMVKGTSVLHGLARYVSNRGSLMTARSLIDKNYADSLETLNLRLTGGTISGTVFVNGQTIDASSVGSSILRSYSTSSNSTITWSEYNYYTGVGTDTWILPAISGNTGKLLIVKNEGTGSITISRSGSDNIFSTSIVTSVTILSGQSFSFQNNSSYWDAR